MTERLEEGLTEHEAADLDEQDRLRGHDLLKTVEFGLQVEDFIEGPIGLRLIADSDEERAALMEEAVHVDTDTPDGLARHRAIRHRVAVLDHWQNLFASYINEGVAAQKQYQEGEAS
jgi:hypothetical protein